jgi:hypothetical protein
MQKKRFCFLLTDIGEPTPPITTDVKRLAEEIGWSGHTVWVFARDGFGQHAWKWEVPIWRVAQLGACTRRFDAVIFTDAITFEWVPRAPVVHRYRVLSFDDDVVSHIGAPPALEDHVGWKAYVEAAIGLFTTPITKK